MQESTNGPREQGGSHRGKMLAVRGGKSGEVRFKTGRRQKAGQLVFSKIET